MNAETSSLLQDRVEERSTFSQTAHSTKIIWSRSALAAVGLLIGAGIAVAGVAGVHGRRRSNTKVSSVTSLDTSLISGDPSIDFSFANGDMSTTEAETTAASYPFLEKHRLVEPMKLTTVALAMTNLPSSEVSGPIKCTHYIEAKAAGGVYDNIVSVTPAADFRPSGSTNLHAADDVNMHKHIGSFSVTFPSPGTYSLALTCEWTPNAGTLSSLALSRGDKYTAVSDVRKSVTLSGTVTCMYIRRELRDLSKTLRNDYLDAFKVMIDVPTKNGIEEYGPSYRNIKEFEIMHVKGAANRDADMLHDGLGLITQHLSMSAEMEISLQSVNPKVALPYWDYTIDAYEVETRQRSGRGGDFSDIFSLSGHGGKDGEESSFERLFSEDWFGKTEEAGHTVTKGRFAYQEVPRDYNFTTRSPYGFLRAPWNINPSKYVTRYHKFCGEKPSAEFFIDTNWDASLSGNHFAWPSCKTHYMWTNMAAFDSWYDYAMDIGYSPHGPVHAWIGGVGGQCEGGVWDELYAQGKLNHMQLMNIKHNSFVVLKNAWRLKIIETPKYCSPDTPVSECMWTCVTSEGETPSQNPEMKLMFETYLNIKASNPHYEELVNKIMCETPYWPGDQLEAASPADVSFWPIHPTLDRMLQYKHLARPFTDKNWSTYETGTTASICVMQSLNCKGHNPMDDTFFQTTVKEADGKYKKKHLKNLQLREASNPAEGGYALPYIYNNFEWNHCTELGVSFRPVYDAVTELRKSY